MQVVKRSAQKNGSFQKLFALPAEEFLINDFACAIKKKILIQVCLFCPSANASVKFMEHNLFGQSFHQVFLYIVLINCTLYINYHYYFHYY